ncbi:hypothetical protein CH063_15780, partial [Colletotrichum higginsianum]
KQRWVNWLINATTIQLSASLGYSESLDSAASSSFSPALSCACWMSLMLANLVLGSSWTALLFLTAVLVTWACRSSSFCWVFASSYACSLKPFFTFLNRRR